MKLSRASKIAGALSLLTHVAAAAAIWSAEPPRQRPRSLAVALEFKAPRPQPPPPEPKPEPRPELAPPTPPTTAPRPSPQARHSPARPAPVESPPQPAPLPPIATATASSEQQVALPVPVPTPAPAPPPAAAPVKRPGASDGSGTDLTGYLGRVNRSVASQRRYPPMALELQLEGDVLVSARVHRSGALAGQPSIARSSGHELLDEEALRMVTRAAPLPALPPDYPEATAELRIPVRFRLAD